MIKYKIFAMLLSLACAVPFVACDDDAPRTELNSPALSETSVSFCTLSFSWDAVPHTMQYGYKLLDPDGTVVSADVVQDTYVEFSNLKASTTYKLQVWAFAGLDTDYTTSPAAELIATTDAIVKLATPVLSLVYDGENPIISWDAVANAQGYRYTITNASGVEMESSYTSHTSYAPKMPEPGEYTITMCATTNVAGFEDSDMASITFNVIKHELYSVDGVYTSFNLASSWDATMVAYSDGSYSVKNFYGVEGYDFAFTINEDGYMDMLVGQQGGSSSFIYWIVPTGLSALPELRIYPWDLYSYLSGDKDGGELGIGCYNADDMWGYDTFVWGGEESSMTVDDLVGTYSNVAEGVSYFTETWDPENFLYDDYMAVVEKVDDTTVSIDGLYYLECPVKGKVDFSSKTITFDAQDYGYGYTFASENGADQAVVATFTEDGSINIPYFCLWMDGYWYLWCKNTLTKSSSVVSYAKQKAPDQKRS